MNLDEQIAPDYSEMLEDLPMTTEEIIKIQPELLNNPLCKEYLLKASETKLLDPEEELALVRRIGNGDIDAVNKLKEAKLKLVIAVAKKHIDKGLSFFCLIQAGDKGLDNAIKEYDYTRGYKFDTYAIWFIRQAITRAIVDHGREHNIPAYMIKAVNDVKRISEELTKELGREPSAEEIAARSDDLTVEKVYKAKEYSL